MSVGGELVDVSRTPGPGQVYDVNSVPWRRLLVTPGLKSPGSG